MLRVLRPASASAIILVPFLLLQSSCLAQTSPNCNLLGPVFPVPSSVLRRSSTVPRALLALNATLQLLIENAGAGGGDPDAASSTSGFITAFSADETLFRFGHAAPGLNGSLTFGTLDENTIFRIGSISKLLTVYAFLATANGFSHVNDPVTMWIPELRAPIPSEATNNTSEVRDAVSTVAWDQVTLGSLASHMSGISRDLSLQDISLVYNSSVAAMAALPGLPDKLIRKCGFSNLVPNCSRQEFFHDLRALHPVTTPFSTPVYSNIAFQLLAYALEGITSTPFPKLLQSALLGPLNLTRTSLEAPVDSSNSIIPDTEILSWWNVTTGDGSPYGGMFSTAADLTKIGQSILSSSILEPALTRQWLKPSALTAHLRSAVGMPWEIHRLELPIASLLNSTRVVDLYTKNGALGGYTSYLALSPDHGAGFAILLASPARSSALRGLIAAVLADTITDVLFPALEEAAREQAAEDFAGTYRSPFSSSQQQQQQSVLVNQTTATAFTITLIANDSRPGLGVSRWTRDADGLDVLAMYAAHVGIPASLPASLRLYPMGPTPRGGGGRVAFRGVYEVVAVQNVSSAGGTADSNSSTSSGIYSSKAFTSGCWAWGGVGSPTYGNVGFDDFVFDVDAGGRATGLEVRVARSKLVRQVG